MLLYSNVNVASSGLQVKSEMALGRCSTPEMFSMEASSGENANTLWAAAAAGRRTDERRETINHLSRADAVFHVKIEREVTAR